MAIRVKTASGNKIEVPGEFVDPVQLQVVCQTLWEKLPADKAVITRADIDQYANVDEALSDFYETSLRRAVTAANNAIQVAPVANSGEMMSITEGAVRLWFDQKLITREGKRNMVFREASTTADLSNAVVDELENQHLIRVEIRGGEPWYELSHDRFISPIRESNRRFQMQQPEARRKAQELEERADAWLKSNRSEKLLLNRAELLDAQKWLRKEAAAIGYSETLFSLIGASEAAIQHEDAQQQQKLTDALSRQAIAEHQRARQFRLGLMVASLLFLLTLGSTGFAVNRWRKAQAAQAMALSASADIKRSYDESIRQYKYAEIQRHAAEAANADLARVNGYLKDANIREQAHRKTAEEAKSKAEAEQKIATQKAQEAKAAEQQSKANAERAVTSLNQLTATTWADKALKASENDPETALGIALLAFNRAPEQESTEYALRQAYLRFKGHSTLKGHEGVVTDAIYSPDGKFIFTASEDSTVKMWDASTKQELKQFTGHERGIHGLAITGDGTLIATEAADSTGRIWKVNDPTRFFPLADLSGPVAALAFSPDGRLLATEATNGKEKAGAAPRLWDTSTGKIFHTLIGHKDAVSALAFSPDGRYLVTASWDSTARIWDVSTGHELKVLEGHTAPLTSVAFSPDGKLIVTGSYDGTARTWEAASGNPLKTLAGHSGAVQTVAFNPRGDVILTSGKQVRPRAEVSGAKIPLPKEIRVGTDAPLDNTVRLFSCEGKTLGVFSQEDEINSAAFGANGRVVITASKDGTARAWDVNTGRSIGQFRPPQEVEDEDEGVKNDKSKNSAVLSPDNHYLLTSANDRTAEVWRIDSVWPLPQFALVSPILDVKFASNDLIVSSSLKGIRYWSLGTRSWTPAGMELTGKDFPPPQSAVISVDEKSIVTVTKDGTAQVRDLDSKKVLLDLEKTTTPPRRVTYSPRQTYIAGTSSGSVYIWAAATGKLMRTFREDILISDVAFSIDERYFAIARRDGKVETFELSNGTSIKLFQANNDAINSIRFDSETERPLIVTSSVDRTARLCTFDGKCFPSLRGHIAAVSFADFSRDGKLIVTVGRDGRVRVWQINAKTSSASLVTEMRANSQQFTIAKFNADGTKIVAGTQSRSVITFECEVCRPIEQVQALVLGLRLKQPEKQQLDDRQIYPTKEELDKIWGIQSSLTRRSELTNSDALKGILR